MKKTLTTFLAVLLVFCAYAQIAIEKTPPSFNKNMAETAVTHQLPAFDAQAMLAEDEATKGEGPLRFGKRHKVDMNLKQHGTWERLPNGDRIWRMTFYSPEAYSLNFLFSKFQMPEGAELYAYNADRSEVRGAFTVQNNKADGMFAITPVHGDEVTLEYYEPVTVRGEGLLEISYVVHAYRNLHETMEEILAKDYGDSGSCNNDVACTESAGWEDQIRSVAIIIDNGFRACTGAMVNNVAQDGTPYFLSANHCGVNISSNWSFVFNYDSPSCDGPDGDLSNSIVGGELRAAYGPSDFSLFELSTPPPSGYAVYFAGWNKLDEAATSNTAIHHPAGDVKKISFNDDALYEGAWGSGDAPVPGGDHWIVDDWEDGTTEGGSSGSPIFDQNKLIVGQLHGGGASCTNVVYDSYGKFFSSWEGGGSPSTRLKDWLGEGQDTLHGAYFIDPPLPFNVQAVNVSGADGVICTEEVAPQILVRNIGGMEISSFTVEYGYDSDLSNTFEWTGDPLGFYASVTIDLPATTVPLGMHTFDAVIANPNGNPDDDDSNNTATSSFEIIEGNTLTVNLTADNYPGETSYEITDQNTGEILHIGSGFAGNMLNINDFCLNDGCYTFTIFDAYLDGICCGYGEGNYELVDDDGDVLGSGGEFGAQESVQFCLPLVVTANFSAPETACVNTPVAMTNASQLATSYNWLTPGAMPDMSTDESPAFTYATPGTYMITLTVDDGTDSSTTTREIEITDGNGLNINLVTDDYPEETSYIVTNQSTGDVVLAAGDFNLVGQLFVESLCLSDGCYTFTIQDLYGDGICCGYGEGGYEIIDNEGTVIAGGGNFAMSENVDFCLPFEGAVAVANFAVSSPTICAGASVSVTNNSTNAESYSWSAPGAMPEMSADENPTFTYAEAGTYTITLTASNETSSSTAEQEVVVAAIPVAGPITGAEMPVNGSTEMYMTPLNSGSVYTWRVEGGTQVSGGNTNMIEVMWSDPNNMAFICVTETDANGCQSGELCYDVLTVVNMEDIAFEKGLNVFPNPTDGMLYIESNEVPENIELFDVIGQSININYEDNIINISQQTTGIYLLRVTYEQGSVTRRIVMK